MHFPGSRAVLMLPVPRSPHPAGYLPVFETISPRGKVTLRIGYRERSGDTGGDYHAGTTEGYPLPDGRAECCMVYGRMGRGTNGYLLLPDGKRLDLTSPPVSLVDPVHGSGSLWASHQSTPRCRIPSTGAGNRAGMSAGGGFVLNWVLLMVRRIPRFRVLYRFYAGCVPMNPSSLSEVTLVYPYFRCRLVEELFPSGNCLSCEPAKGTGIPVTVEDCTFETFDEVVDRIARSGLPLLVFPSWSR